MRRRLRWLYPFALLLAGCGFATESLLPEREGLLLRWGPSALSWFLVIGVNCAFLRTPIGRPLFWMFVARTSFMFLLFGSFFGLGLLATTQWRLGALVLGTTALFGPAAWILLRYATSAELWSAPLLTAPVSPWTQQDRNESDEKQEEG